MGDYDEDHTSDHCDKCEEKVGAGNLERAPFLFCNQGDTMHPDVSYLLGYEKEGYRQYYICKSCMQRENRIFAKRRNYPPVA